MKKATTAWVRRDFRCALLLAVTAAGCLFGVMAAVGSVWSLGILFVLCLVAAHVAGNSLGTKLRDQATRRSAVERSQGASPTVNFQIGTPPRLAGQARLHWMTPAVTLSGALAGGALGGLGSAFLYPEAGAPALGLGVASAAVLGSFVAFAVSSFVSVARAAWGEALRDPAGSRLAQRPPQ